VQPCWLGICKKFAVRGVCGSMVHQARTCSWEFVRQPVNSASSRKEYSEFWSWLTHQLLERLKSMIPNLQILLPKKGEFWEVGPSQKKEFVEAEGKPLSATATWIAPHAHSAKLGSVPVNTRLAHLIVIGYTWSADQHCLWPSRLVYSARSDLDKKRAISLFCN
jgi:hypothetical protein